MANPNDFLLNTDYMMDKIILLKTGSFVGSLEIPHSFKNTPLPFGVWSTNSNFESSNTLGAVEYGGVGSEVELGVACRANDSKILLESHGNGNDSTTIYYRLYAFAQNNDNTNIGATSKWAKTFVLNTDYNYLKLYANGEFNENNLSYTHNLGYIPQVMAWRKYINVPGFPEISEMIEPIASYYMNDDAPGIKLTPTTISTSGISGSMFDKIIWRIYYDKA